MKKKLLLIGLIVVLILSAGYWLKSKKTSGKTLTLSTEQLEQYYAAYQDPDVLFLRTSLNNFLDEKTDGMALTAIEATNSGETLYGLKNFSKDYYKSKFIVTSIAPGLFGGKYISVMFQDKPDKVFTAWTYQLSDNTYELRGFWQQNMSPEDFDNLIQNIKPFLKDRTHNL